MKSFEISGIYTINEARKKWTINLKSFEIADVENALTLAITMNYKLEKFWNIKIGIKWCKILGMNYKLEKFWNVASGW